MAFEVTLITMLEIPHYVADTKADVMKYPWAQVVTHLLKYTSRKIRISVLLFTDASGYRSSHIPVDSKPIDTMLKISKLDYLSQQLKRHLSFSSLQTMPLLWFDIAGINQLLSGVPDYFDRNKILSGYDLSHYQVPHCIFGYLSIMKYEFY